MLITDVRRFGRWTGVLVAAATLLSLTAQPASAASARQGVDLSSLPVVGGLLGGGCQETPNCEEDTTFKQEVDSTPLTGRIEGTITADPLTGSFEIKIGDVRLSGRSRKYGNVTIDLAEDNSAGKVTGNPGNLHSELTLKLVITIEKPPQGVPRVTYLGSVTFIATNWDAVPPTKGTGWTTGPLKLQAGVDPFTIRIVCIAPDKWKLPCNH